MSLGKKVTLVSAGAILVLMVSVFFIADIYNEYYRNRVYPGILVGNYSLGGLTRIQAVGFIENINNRIAKEGLHFSVIDRQGKIIARTINALVASDSSGELIHLNSEATASRALKIGRAGSYLRDFFEPLYRRLLAPLTMSAIVEIDERNLEEALRGGLADLEDAPRNARIIFPSGQAESYQILPEHAGFIFDYHNLINGITTKLANFSFEPIEVSLENIVPGVGISDVENLAPLVPNLVHAHRPFVLIYREAQGSTSTRSLSEIDLLNWLEARRLSDGKMILGLSQSAVSNFLERNLRPVIDQPAKEARFLMEDDGRVKEFQASQEGVSLNTALTYEALDNAFSLPSPTQTTTVSVVIDMVEPQVTVAEVNGLGITDIIGVGISTFKDSHTNRIKNIARAVTRLNGILIKPGEEFSTLKYAGPFTAKNGFLPEMVIKGREIKPEIGGGMCQIGTTLFRMAMNSGMPITERRNHSLVVGYYADPVNHNPGTDATVYEPLLDFKFLNDTGNYLLLETEIDFKKQQLTFALWGKPDGRKGYYTHPTVSKWIVPGDPEEVIINNGKLKPGEKKCQNAFPGAVAHFTYTRVTASGETIDKIFDSYYRPLPKICMLGASVSSTPAGSSGNSLNPENLPAESTTGIVE